MSVQENKGIVQVRVFGHVGDITRILVPGVQVRITTLAGVPVDNKDTTAESLAKFNLEKGDYLAHVDLPAPQAGAAGGATRRGRSAAQAAQAASLTPPPPKQFCIVPRATNVVEFDLDLENDLSLTIQVGDGSPEPLTSTRIIPYGRNAILTATNISTRFVDMRPDIEIRGAHTQTLVSPANERRVLAHFDSVGSNLGNLALSGPAIYSPNAMPAFAMEVPPAEPSVIEGGINVSMQRTGSRRTNDLGFWPTIRRNTDALLFKNYFDFMEWLFCEDPLRSENPIDTARVLPPLGTLARSRFRSLPFTDTDAYRNVKAATEAFVMANCGFCNPLGGQREQDEVDFINNQVVVPTHIGDIGEWLGRYLNDSSEVPGLLPYLAVIRNKMKDQQIKQSDIGDVELDKFAFKEGVNTCYGLLRSRLKHPCFLELIWSYWQEEGMLAQTMNAIARRFQNVRAPGSNDPLANLEIDPLRPLNNVLWGYIQDEQHRLSVVRRNYEYDHHYGLRLSGKAVSGMRTADSRSKFLEAFHTLLSTVSRFYRLDDDTTVKADAFPVLNALKEAHLILSQGAHNQFGDLPTTARIEMLMQQWILARPEFREFIPTRIMVAYPEPWMDRVDAMKKLQTWTDTSVLHFRNLAIFGEQVLLSIRFGNWNDVNDPAHALNWARYWRSEIQGYLHAYRSVTAVDLSVDVTNARIDATMPSVHLVKRLSEQQRTA